MSHPDAPHAATATFPDAAPGPPPDGLENVAVVARRRWILTATSLAAFVAFLDATIVNIAFPSLQASFPHASRSGLSWILNGYNIVFAALLVPAGRIADLLGRRRVFVAGVALFAASSMLCGLAPSVPVLVALRAAQAAGAALLVPTSLALLLDTYPPAERVQAIAVLGSAAALAAACGPVFGGVLVHAFDWRAVFFVNLPFCAVAAFLARRHVRERRDAERKAPDAAAVLLLTGGMALVALGLTRADLWGWGSARVLGCLALGAVALVAFAVRARAEPEVAVLRRPAVRMANASILVFAAAFYAKILIDVLFLTSIWHYSVLLAGAAMTPGPLVTALLARPGGRLGERLGFAPVAALGAVVYAAGCAWFALRCGPHADYASVWLPGAACTGVGLALAFPSLTSAAVASLPSPRFATGSAVNAASRQLGGVLGIAVAVSILGAQNRVAPRADFVHAWTYAAIGAGLAGAVAIALARGTSTAAA